VTILPPGEPGNSRAPGALHFGLYRFRHPGSAGCWRRTHRSFKSPACPTSLPCRYAGC
jgi:hypothetical protein